MTKEWYQDGLRFECTLCGACCSGAPGIVRFTDDEAVAMAAKLGITVAEFRAKYVRVSKLTGEQALIEVQKEHGYDCVFLDRTTMPGKAICSLYEARPLQCRTFPWWPEHLESPKAWKRLGKSCEGVGRGNVVRVEEIRVERAKAQA